MRNSRPILLVEDDEVDALTVKRALKEIDVDNEVIHVENGEEALEYLSRGEKVKPTLIFLDLSMPVMNGLEFLDERMKSDELRSIPTVVLTTSRDDYDMQYSFKLSIAGYVVKPVDYGEFVEIMKKIDSYWSISESLEN